MISLATIGVCVFGALTSVGALFYFAEIRRCMLFWGMVFISIPQNKKVRVILLKSKKLGIVSLTAGVILNVVGFLTLESSSNFWSYNSSMRTIMRFTPWFLIVIGVFGVLTGIFYIVTNMKPTVKRKGKVIEKNNSIITVEFEDGSRENLVTSAKIVLGDEGTFETKSNIIVNFYK